MDNLDKVVGTYSCRQMAARWPLVVFHNILDVSSYNAFVIWREITPNWMPCKRNKHRVFLEQLGKATGAIKRKRCQLCPPKKDSMTHTVCCRCKKYICKGCSHAYCHTCAHWALSQDGTG